MTSTGQRVYLSNELVGRVTGSAPSSGFARVVGHCISGSGETNRSDIIYFNPDNTWVEIS